MPFKRLDITQVPRRLWALVGFPGSGKSTFAMQMRGPVLAIDADQRVDEVARLAQTVSFPVVSRPFHQRRRQLAPMKKWPRGGSPGPLSSHIRTRRTQPHTVHTEKGFITL